MKPDGPGLGNRRPGWARRLLQEYAGDMFLRLGSRRFDLTQRPVLVGILNRTRDSFFDRGAHHQLDRLLARAEQLVADGADVLEVGARPGGVGVADVPPDLERDLAAESIAQLRSRFDVPWAWTPPGPRSPGPPLPKGRRSATT